MGEILNRDHSPDPKPQWFGESVGHYENGDTLVIDTIALVEHPLSFVDNYRTPHTKQLHVVERWKMSADKRMIEVSFKVDDPGAFNMPWSARQTFHRTRTGMLEEAICAENNVAFESDAAVSEIPHADKPDF